MAPVKKKVHLNVDLGEGYGNFKCGPDDELIPMIDHVGLELLIQNRSIRADQKKANVACGFHAGDPLVRIVFVTGIEHDVLRRS